MTDLEDLVRQTFATHAQDPLGPVDLHASVLRRRSRRRTTSVTAAAVLTLLAAAGSIVHLRSGTHPDSLVPAASGPAVPAGDQAASFHGLQLFVPAAWPVNAVDCGEPVLDTVTFGAVLVATCGRSPVAGITSVALNISSPQDPLAMLATTPTTVDGHPARRGTGRITGAPDPYTVLVIPDLDVTASVRSANLTLAAQLLDTAHVVDIDSNGCAAQVSTLAPTATQTPAGADTQLVPGTPTGATLCRYSSNWVVRSMQLTGVQRTELVDTLNSLPRQSMALVPGPNCSSESGRGFIVRFSYADGSVLPVMSHVNDCAPGGDNGARQGRLTRQLEDMLTRLAGYDSWVANPATLPR